MDAKPMHTVAPPATKRKTSWSNLGVGAFMNLFQVTTLGQPMEVLKTHVAANRNDSLRDAVRKTWARGRIAGFYQGLIPWAWIEASTKGGILILTSTEVEHYAKRHLSTGPEVSGVLGGVAGGAAQAYLTMGLTTCMKTVEVTRNKSAAGGQPVKSPMATFADIVRTRGIRGVYRGVNAVALRQITGWSSRIGISRAAEGWIRAATGKKGDARGGGEGKKPLSFGEKILASSIGGALSCWNQPFEVLRVEMQSMKKAETTTAGAATAGGSGKNLTMVSVARHILATSGPLGLFRGVVPRIGVAVWATVCMVGFGDVVKETVASWQK